MSVFSNKYTVCPKKITKLCLKLLKLCILLFLDTVYITVFMIVNTCSEYVVILREIT